MLNNERDASSRRSDLLRVCDCDGGGTKHDNVTFGVIGGIGVRSCLDCGDTRCPGTSSAGKSGLKISPDVNRHDGQGTASITADFQNSYIELMWPDPTVSVAPGAERGVEKFKNRMNWRASGWCPIGIGLHRVGTATPLPFPTWTIAPDWMPKGTAIEILTARDDTKSPSFFIEPDVLAVKEKGKTNTDDPKAGSLQHEIGVKR